MKILGLDLGTTTGFCFYNSADGGLSWGHGVLKYKPHRTTVTLEERLAAFESDLAYRLIGQHSPNAVVYEIAHMRGGPATRSALGMETILKLVTFKAGIVLHGVHSATLKKFSTGDGRADKAKMVIAARLITDNHRIIDDNEADAICLANWGRMNGVENAWGRIEFKKRVPVTRKKTHRQKEEK